LRAGRIELHRIDAKLAQEPGRNNTVGPRAVDLQRTSVYQLHPSADFEFVAPRMIAKVVVIVENENPRRRFALPVEIGG
jgi:hypothetical protein